jgi:hypothetical protein
MIEQEYVETLSWPDYRSESNDGLVAGGFSRLEEQGFSSGDVVRIRQSITLEPTSDRPIIDRSSTPIVEREVELDRALRNCLAYAIRKLPRGSTSPVDDLARNIIRFCKEVGVEPSMLRGDS